MMWAHPVAFQRAFAALVREGRAFAETPDGAALKDVLSGSELAAHSRLIWDMLSASAFSADETAVLPSAFLNAVAKAAASPQLESLLNDAFIDGK
jgi:hypothetical protein